MRIAVFILALLGGLACGALGWMVKSAEQTSEAAQLVRQLDEEMARLNKDEAEAARELGLDPARVREAADRLRRIVHLCYALLAAFPLAVGGGLLVLNRRGLLAA